MASKTTAASFFLVSILLLASTALPPAFACDSCSQPGRSGPPVLKNIKPGGGLFGTSAPPSKCSSDDHLKLGLCLDVLGGLVHVGAGDPAENLCCPVMHGLLEVEAAVCLCTAIKLKVLNLDIYIPLALNLLITCGKSPDPSAYLCPHN